MFRHLLSSLGQAALVMLGVFILVFVMVRLTGDPARAMLAREASPEQLEALRRQMGYDRPVIVQFFDYLGKTLTGDFGNSLHYRTPALPLVLERLPATLELAFVALLMALVIAVPLGLAGGARPGSFVDVIGRTIGLLGQTTPAYWLGLVMIIVFAVHLRWFPTSGRSGPLSVVMPAFALALPTMGRLVRLTRSAVMEIMGDDFVRTARSKGLANRTVFYRHVLRNASIPLVSVLGIQFGYMLGGSVIIESVFAWPGIGRLAIDAISIRDFPLVQAVALFASFVVVVLNLLTDLAYSIIDPRIRYG
ncbi:MAG: ABC transporter permease [Chloroflexi bacterium]|nr:MAG: ABC transporter permease [Chloroflexota bacterium]